MSAGDFAVHVVNPRHKKGGHRKGRRTKRNPSFGGGGGGNLLRTDWMRVVWMIAGDLWISYFTRTWGDKWGTSMLDGKALTSPYAGQAWTMKNYLMAAATGFGLAKLLQRMGRSSAASDFMLGIKVGLARRVVWTEGFARVGWGQKYFGDIADMYERNGSWYMQTPGGYQQAMDGPQVANQPWMMAGPQVPNQRWMMLGPGEEMQTFDDGSPMGHALIGPKYSAELASYSQSGDQDPYAASYSVG